VTDDHVDIVKAGVDIAVRIGEFQDFRLKSRLLISSKLFPCASTNYLDRMGVHELGEGLSQHQLVYMSHLPSLEKRQQHLMPHMMVVEQQKKLIVNDVILIYNAVKSGIGISLLPDYLIRKDIESCTLVQLFSGQLIRKHEVFMLIQSAEFVPLKTRVFIDFLVTYFDN